MQLVEKYRRYADEAIANSRAASDLNTRREWLEIANAWTELADARLSALANKLARDRGENDTP